MDAETVLKVTQGKEDDAEGKRDEGVNEVQSDHMETTTKDDVLASKVDIANHEDENDGDEAVLTEDREAGQGDSSEVAGNHTAAEEEPSATIDGEKVATSADVERSSPTFQAERNKSHGGEGSKDANIDNDVSKSDSGHKAQSAAESETKKAPEGKKDSEGTQRKVLLNVPREKTEAADENKAPSTATAADNEQGITSASYITQQSLHTQSRESESGGKAPASFSRTSLLIMSILSTVFFFPMGVIALYYAIKVRDNFQSRYEMSKVKDYARRSTFCSIAGIVTGFAALLLILLIIILGITGVVHTE